MEKPGPAEGFTMWRFAGPYSELCVETKGDGAMIIRHCRLCGEQSVLPGAPAGAGGVGGGGGGRVHGPGADELSDVDDSDGRG